MNVEMEEEIKMRYFDETMMVFSPGGGDYLVRAEGEYSLTDDSFGYTYGSIHGVHKEIGFECEIDKVFLCLVRDGEIVREREIKEIPDWLEEDIIETVGERAE